MYQFTNRLRKQIHIGLTDITNATVHVRRKLTLAITSVTMQLLFF